MNINIHIYKFAKLSLQHLYENITEDFKIQIASLLKLNDFFNIH